MIKIDEMIVIYRGYNPKSDLWELHCEDPDTKQIYKFAWFPTGWQVVTE